MGKGNLMKTNEITTYRSLSDEDKAFMDAFNYTHEQYSISDEDIVGFLCGADISFDGYTQVADAHNLWEYAISFARGEK